MPNEKYACIDKDGKVLNTIVLNKEDEEEFKKHVPYDLVRYDHLPIEEHAEIHGTYDKTAKKFKRAEHAEHLRVNT